jgi:transaldolase/glucose-6-phosphate isomerase
MAPNPLRSLQQQYGQSVWLDYIGRSLISSGGLKRLVEEDGLRGMTSNLTIFDKALGESSDYDDALRAAIEAEPGLGTKALFERVAMEDIRMAADVLRPVYDGSGRVDGFVSFEVSPEFAFDREATISEARRLWKAIGRPNVMIKVPATPEGVFAIEALIGEGINVNATLMFSLAHYEAVAQAYLRGLRRNKRPGEVASVASFFVSRVDTVVDEKLEEIGTPEALALRGKTGIANCKVVYQRYLELFKGKSFAALAGNGARVQRPLWASTGTKNKTYSDVLYVEELIGPDTVNTLPPITLEAFRDHGKPRASLEASAEEAQKTLAQLRKLGIDLEAVTETLQGQGIAAFAESYEKLLQTLEGKRSALLDPRLDTQQLSLGGVVGAVEKRLEQWTQADFAKRMWSKDYTLWARNPNEITNRLGWLRLPETMLEHAEDIARFADDVRGDGVEHVVLLGMGGSSLAPDVFRATFGSGAGCPDLKVLDSTHPAAVHSVEKSVNLARTLFLVSSKSGTTIEPLSSMHYFWAHVGKITKNPGGHFAAITDPGTALGKLGRERGFRRVFEAVSDVGGRYSALTHFGLVPAALVGVDVRRLLQVAGQMARACAGGAAAKENPGLVLGAALGELALAGKDKVTFVTSPALGALPMWFEQLIAESTGKEGKGIVPVAGEPLGPPEVYGQDRVFACLGTEWRHDQAEAARIAALEATGHPVIRINMGDLVDLAQEFFRWEVATAAAGAVIGVQPFDQPDVELAKELARKAISGASRSSEGPAAISAESDRLQKATTEWLSKARSGDYLSIQAYLAPTQAMTERLTRIQQKLRDRTHLATTVGYGPRFLHSTGQLHKGGPNAGLFVQFTDEPADRLPVPETDYDFAGLIHAQALGDSQALVQRGRRVLRVNLGRDAAAGLSRFEEALKH